MAIKPRVIVYASVFISVAIIFLLFFLFKRNTNDYIEQPEIPNTTDILSITHTYVSGGMPIPSQYKYVVDEGKLYCDNTYGYEMSDSEIEILSKIIEKYPVQSYKPEFSQEMWDSYQDLHCYDCGPIYHPEIEITFRNGSYTWGAYEDWSKIQAFGDEYREEIDRICDENLDYQHVILGSGLDYAIMFKNDPQLYLYDTDKEKLTPIREIEGSREYGIPAEINYCNQQGEKIFVSYQDNLYAYDYEGNSLCNSANGVCLEIEKDFTVGLDCSDGIKVYQHKFGNNNFIEKEFKIENARLVEVE